MTQEEYNEAAALVVRLREECTQAKDIAACLEQTNDDLTRALAANVDALVKSNAQCAEYLRQNEQLTAELDRMKGDPLPIKLVGKLKDAEDSNKTLHSELVEVRSALASVTEQRDSLRRTLAEWELADTKPHARIDEVAQVVPVCMQCLKERIKTAHDYETGPSVAILTKPILPDGVADHVVPPVLPLCMKCHGCGFVLETDSRPGALYCMNFKCDRTNTADTDSPYNGPCNSAVRHE